MCGVKKGTDERINESILRWFGHMERMDENRLVKRMYSGECVGKKPVGRPKKRWIELVRDCLKERNVSMDEARRMVLDRNEWRGFCKGVSGGEMIRGVTVG